MADACALMAGILKSYNKSFTTVTYYGQKIKVLNNGGFIITAEYSNLATLGLVKVIRGV